jgi:hypothetical protein
MLRSRGKGRQPSANGSIAECRACKTFVRAEDLREREYDKLLVCPECNFIEPVKRVFIAADRQDPIRYSPPTVPPPTPKPDSFPPLIQMNRKPNFRDPL